MHCDNLKVFYAGESGRFRATFLGYMNKMIYNQFADGVGLNTARKTEIS